MTINLIRLQFRRAFTWMVCFFILFTFQQSAHAVSSKPLFSFTAEVVPSSQLLAPFGFYHLKIDRSQSIPLQAKITNHLHHAIEIQSEIINAYSSTNGIIYQNAHGMNQQNSSIIQKPNELANYASPLPILHLKPLESRIISFKLSVPHLKKGTILGAIRFKNLTTPTIKSDVHSNFAFIPFEAIELAIQIDFSKPDQFTPLQPLTVAFDPNQKCLRATFQQPSRNIRKHVSGEFQVQDITNQTLFQGNTRFPALAPSTQFESCLPWLASTIKEGTYHFVFREKNKSSSFSKPIRFKILPDQIKQIKQLAEQPHSSYIMLTQTVFPNWVWVLIFIIIFESIYLVRSFFRKK